MRSVQRNMDILRAIIEEYIDTAAPVGSASIRERYNLDVSAATVRNIMAELEEMGYIAQPYTSAGRVPTDIGYRMYVDALMRRLSLSERDKGQIRDSLETDDYALDQFAHRVSEILANWTMQASVVFLPALREASVHSVNILPLDRGRALLVLIASSGLVKECVINLPPGINREDTRALTGFLDEKLAGKTFSELEEFAADEDPSGENEPEAGVLQRAAREVTRTICSLVGQDGRFYLEGMSHMLEYPEFADSERLKTLLKTLENEECIARLLAQGAVSTGPTILIGDETTVEVLRDCALVISAYRVGRSTHGSLGIIGPKRMDYARLSAIVECVAEEVNNALARLL